MTLEISTAHKSARSAASVAFADTGVANSKLRLYASADWTGTPLVEIILKKPCGTVNGSGLIVLEQATAGGDLIASTGAALTGDWINGDGDLVARGTVSDSAGTGDFKLQGTSGTTLYAGGSAILGTTALG
jgi:hypothetical protein